MFCLKKTAIKACAAVPPASWRLCPISLVVVCVAYNVKVCLYIARARCVRVRIIDQS